MNFRKIRLSNWRNFQQADVRLHRRCFLVGPNASGKSTFLDAFRFIRDIADPQGGLQRAVKDRRGVSQIRSLHARRYSEVSIELEVELDESVWVYELTFRQDNQSRPLVQRERVVRNGKQVMCRPDAEDEKDTSRLTQTYLEQVNANKEFRPLQDFFSKIRYLHIVPQLIREPDRFSGREGDPYGGDFLDLLATTPKKTLESRLRRITEALRVAVPQLKELKLTRDERGTPHLYGLYEHWRPKAGWQTEDQFSDGTLRLLGLLWGLLDGTYPLLLEEPELSLHSEVIRYLPAMMARLGRKSGRQVILSTHSADLLADEGIALEEVLLLDPTGEGTKIGHAADDQQAKILLQSGVPLAEVVLTKTAPKGAQKLAARLQCRGRILPLVGPEGP